MKLSGTFKGTAVSTALAFAALCLWLAVKPEDPVKAHLDRYRALQLASAPLSFTDYFRPRTWRWFYLGRPSPLAISEQLQGHQKALVTLGYLETKELRLHRRVLDSSTRLEFNALVSKAQFGYSPWSYTVSGDMASWITVTARPIDMPGWSNIVFQFEQSGSK